MNLSLERVIILLALYFSRIQQYPLKKGKKIYIYKVALKNEEKMKKQHLLLFAGMLFAGFSAAAQPYPDHIQGHGVEPLGWQGQQNIQQFQMHGNNIVPDQVRDPEGEAPAWHAPDVDNNGNLLVEVIIIQ